MQQRGFTPVIILLIIALLGGIGYFAYTKGFFNSILPKPTPTVENTPLTTPSETTPAAPVKTPTPTKKPTASATPAPGASCGMSYLPDPQNPLIIKLIYSVHSTNGTYMTGAQWDFDGNGSWDTDMSQANGTINHTFPSAGNYTVKLHLKMSDGIVTTTCSKTITVSSAPAGFTVRLTGRVYQDANCNDMREPDEGGISGVTINIIKSDWTIYATLTSNSSGDYELARTLSQGQSLTLQAADIAAPGYVIHADTHTVVLSSSQPSINIDQPQVPASKIGLCP